MSDAETHDTSEVWRTPLREAAALHVFGLILPEDLPPVALDEMVEGYDSPQLCLLAGSTEGTLPHELHDLFDAALAELGLLPMEPVTAARLVVRSIARRAAAGRTPPMDALDEIAALFVVGDTILDLLPGGVRIHDLDLDTLYDLWLDYDCAVDSDGWPAPKVVEQIETKALDEFKRIAALHVPGE